MASINGPPNSLISLYLSRINVGIPNSQRAPIIWPQVLTIASPAIYYLAILLSHIDIYSNNHYYICILDSSCRHCITRGYYMNHLQISINAFAWPFCVQLNRFSIMLSAPLRQKGVVSPAETKNDPQKQNFLTKSGRRLASLEMGKVTNSKIVCQMQRDWVIAIIYHSQTFMSWS